MSIKGITEFYSDPSNEVYYTSSTTLKTGRYTFLSNAYLVAEMAVNFNQYLLFHTNNDVVSRGLQKYDFEGQYLFNISDRQNINIFTVRRHN